MKSEWTYRPLGELVSFASGGTPSKKRDDYWGGTIPWISEARLRRREASYFLHEEAVFLMEYQLLELKKMWLSIKI